MAATDAFLGVAGSVLLLALFVGACLCGISGRFSRACFLAIPVLGIGLLSTTSPDALILGIPLAGLALIAVVRRNEIKQECGALTQFSHLLNALDTAAIITDDKSRVAFLNALAESVTGWSESAAAGQPLEKLICNMQPELHSIWDTEGTLAGTTRSGKSLQLQCIKLTPNHAILIVRRDKLDSSKNEHFKTLADHAPAMIWMTDDEMRFTFFNHGWLEFTGHEFNAALEAGWLESIHPEDRLRVQTDFENAFAARRRFRMEYRMRCVRLEYCWVLNTAVPHFGPAGEFRGYIGSCIDIDDQKREELRAKFVAEASQSLTSSLDNDTTFANLAQAAVSSFADWCAVDVLTDSRAVERVAAAHRNAEKVALCREMARRWPVQLDQPGNIAAVINSGRAVLEPHVTAEMLQRAARSEEHLAHLRDLGLHSLLVVPLQARGRTLGAISFALAETPRSFDESDLRAAEEISHPAALAVDNARLYREAQQANRTKDEFLATVSHELRTPLTAMLGWARLIRSGRLDPDLVARGVQIIERNVRIQAQLIEDLLDISRIVTGKLRIEMKPVQLCSVIEAAIDSVRPVAEARHIALNFDCPADVQLTGDPNRLQQVVWNLLSNAIKFTPERGTVRVELRPNDSFVELSVADTGQGIAPEFLPLVFERFKQADSSASRAYGGLGLGLSIVSYLVEQHGGTVRAASPGEGQGATFTVRLPACPKARTARPRLPTGSSGNLSQVLSLHGLWVLVVEDERDTREFLKVTFEQYGAAVRCASSVPEAMSKIAERLPEVLVCDIGLPGDDGFSLINRLRRQLAVSEKQVPAVALTAYTKEDDRTRILSAGFQLHVPKPVDPNTLVSAVASLTGRWKAPAEAL